MSQWIINEENAITVVTDQVVDLLGFYALNGGSNWTALDATFIQADGERWVAMHTFDTAGQYTIKVVDNNNLIQDLYVSVHVEDREAWKGEASTGIPEIQATLSTLDTQLGSLLTLVTDVQTIVSVVNSTTSSSLNTLNTLDETTRDLVVPPIQSDIAALSALVEGINVSGDLTANLEPIETDLDALAQNLATVQQAIESLATDLGDTNTEVTNLGQQITGVGSALNQLGIDPAAVAEAVWRYTR